MKSDEFCPMNGLVIRDVNLTDAFEIAEIYRHYTENTAVSFEYSAPDKAEIEKRIKNTVKEYPYLVAELDGNVVGYIYAGPFKTRQAYASSVEISIYIKGGFHGMGIGRALYSEIEKSLVKIGKTNMYACIANPEQEDEYLNFNSRKFHEKMGFSLAGSFNKCAYKFGRWYGMIWMEKFIAEHK